MKKLPSIKENLRLRAKAIQAIRLFFIENDFLEVETPLRIPAPAPEAHIDALTSGPWFLHTSPELCMKRLLATGYPRIFQICKCFRAEERGRKHLNEFTMLEWYSANSDYFDLMNQCEEMVRYVLSELKLGDNISYQGNQVSISEPWDRITVKDAFNKYTSTSLGKALTEDRFDEIIAIDIEPHLGKKRPVFLYEYPAEKAALSKLKPGDATVAERFELYISGLELTNAFTELTDPAEQRKRFKEELSYRRQSGKMEYPMPETFLEALPSMPDAAGIAFGIDRFVMLLADTDRIDDVVAFVPEEL